MLPDALGARPWRRPSPPPPPPSPSSSCPPSHPSRHPCHCSSSSSSSCSLWFSNFSIFRNFSSCSRRTVWKNTHPTVSSSFRIFFSYMTTSCLKRVMRETKRRNRQDSKNSRKQMFNQGTSTPSFSRVPARFRCTGPAYFLRFIYLRVCRIWPRKSSFPS